MYNNDFVIIILIINLVHVFNFLLIFLKNYNSNTYFTSSVFAFALPKNGPLHFPSRANRMTPMSRAFFKFLFFYTDGGSKI